MPSPAWVGAGPPSLPPPLPLPPLAVVIPTLNEAAHLPLMEDLDLVERLAGRLRLRCLGPGLLVAGRRWRRLGLWGCLWQNWRLRRAWRRGVGAEALAQRYYGTATNAIKKAGSSIS